MSICLGKRCSFGLLCVSLMGVCHFFVCVLLSLLVSREGHGFDYTIPDQIPDHCLSIYLLLKDLTF